MPSTVPVSDYSNAFRIARTTRPIFFVLILGFIKTKEKQNEPVKVFRASMVAGKPLMGFPVAACTSGTRGKRDIFRVESWIRAMLFRVLVQPRQYHGWGLGKRIYVIEPSFDSSCNWVVRRASRPSILSPIPCSLLSRVSRSCSGALSASVTRRKFWSSENSVENWLIALFNIVKFFWRVTVIDDGLNDVIGFACSSSRVGHVRSRSAQKTRRSCRIWKKKIKRWHDDNASVRTRTFPKISMMALERCQVIVNGGRCYITQPE